MTHAIDLIESKLTALGRHPQRKGDGLIARCPAHEDRNPSLSVNPGLTRDVLIKCHAGCDAEAVMEAMDLKWTDLGERTNGDRPEIVATYDYHDADGTLVYQVCRMVPKSFRQRRPDGRGGWIWKMKGVERVLYHLPDVLAAAAEGGDVWVVEGEKDADRLAALGVVATCNSGGAGKFTLEQAEALRGARVSIVADNDDTGHAHAAEVAFYASSAGAASVRTLQPIAGKDISDHLDAGHGLDDLAPLELAPKEPGPEPKPMDPQGRMQPAGVWLFDTFEEKPPIWGRDDEILWPEDESLLIAAPTGIGKTTLANLIVQASVGLGSGEVLGYPVTECDRVLYLAMDRPAQIRRAMRRVFAEEDSRHLSDRLVIYPAPLPEALDENPWVLAELAEIAQADRVVIDSVKDSMLEASADKSGSAFNRAVQMCNAEGVPSCGLHHQRKAQNGVKPNTIADVYGSNWITAGAGSVLLLWGEPGTGTAELVHLKMPAEPVGPLDLTIDSYSGTIAVAHQWDALAWLRNCGANGGTPTEGGYAMLAAKPNKAQVERVRRKLDRLVERGLATRSGQAPKPVTYRAVDNPDLEGLIGG